MNGATAILLNAGRKLHLQHGPIDLIISVDPDYESHRMAAFEAATVRFETILSELACELPTLRAAITSKSVKPSGSVANRMFTATNPHAGCNFVTPMAAVAGAVADEILCAMVATVPLQRAYVNNGGDIALHLADDQSYTTAMIGLNGRDLGRIKISAQDDIRGIATSGSKGRSLSMGIADSVTVLGRTAASADAAATLIANSVDLPDHRAIKRQSARTLQPDSDLGDRLVVTEVGHLENAEIAAALDAGLDCAHGMAQQGLITATALTLRGTQRSLDQAAATQKRVLEHV